MKNLELKYKDYEQIIYDWLKSKNEKNPDFTFSIRQKGSKGAERDIFIGTEKSKYFGTTLWNIPVAYPGSSTDLINIIFDQSNGNPKYYWQLTQPKDVDGKQNQLALELIQKIAPKLNFRDRVVSKTDESFKTFSFYLHSPQKGYNDIQELLDDLNNDMNKIIPIVDKEIAKLKKENPDFIAEKITSAHFEKMQEKIKKRMDRYNRDSQEENQVLKIAEQKVFEQLKKENHPLAEHEWKFSNGKRNYIWISVEPKEKNISIKQLHYEVLQYKNSLTIELHPEGNTVQRELFSNFISTFSNIKEYKILKWYHDLEDPKEKTFYRLVLKAKSEVNPDSGYEENCVFIINGLKRIYADTQEKLIKYLVKEQLMNLDAISKHPLNQILYGPPGTGKTYKTIDLAVKIAAPEKYDLNNHAENKIIYDELVEKEQIVFTTFHQSMSYEDFVEGIKPSKPELEDQYLKYEIEDGIFKQIVEKSIGESKISDVSGNIVIDSKYFDSMINKVSLGNSNVQEDDAIYEYCINNDCIAIGFGEDINFEGVKTKAEIRKKFKDNGIEVTSTSDFNVAAMERFVLWMKRGQLVFVPNGNQTLRSIGVVDGDYYYQENSPIPYKQFRKVKWLYKEVNLPIKEIYGKKFSQQTIYQIGSNENMIQFFSKNGSSKKQENYVLIIDEINRGNVSQIFGELITLIEKDKRAGEDEALEITLPYSKQKFSVPNNLYIIGTMNTADRSVEALDSALRRRFSFEELMPNPNLLSPENMIVRLWNHPKYFDAPWDDEDYRDKADALYEFLGTDETIEEKFKSAEYQNNKKWNVEMLGKLEDLNGINLETALTTINERIEVLIDRDHTIGHSYFMGLEVTENIEEATKAVFRDKVIPLLQEYFFNDYGKIQLVLGEGFVGRKSESKNLFPGKHEEIDLDEYLQKPNYFFKIDQDNFDLKEAITILFEGKTSESTVLHNVS